MQKHTTETSRLVHRIRSFADAEGLSKGRLAGRAGLRESTLRKFDRDDWNPTLKTLRALESIIPADFDA